MPTRPAESTRQLQLAACWDSVASAAQASSLSRGVANQPISAIPVADGKVAASRTQADWTPARRRLSGMARRSPAARNAFSHSPATRLWTGIAGGLHSPSSPFLPRGNLTKVTSPSSKAVPLCAKATGRPRRFRQEQLLSSHIFFPDRMDATHLPCRAERIGSNFASDQVALAENSL